jgi:hypothetical protein
MSTEQPLIDVNYCDWSTRDNNGVDKVSALLRCYADLRKVIIPMWVSVTTWVATTACVVMQCRVVNPEV